MTSNRIEQLLAGMTLAEKVGQMTQVEKFSITPDEVAEHGIGSVLSGGGGNPEPNTPDAWADMVAAYQDAALRSRLGVPLLYGVDAVHGHTNVYGATVFPHNIGLGATGDPDLVRRVARVTAEVGSARRAARKASTAASGLPLPYSTIPSSRRASGSPGRTRRALWSSSRALP